MDPSGGESLGAPAPEVGKEEVRKEEEANSISHCRRVSLAVGTRGPGGRGPASCQSRGREGRLNSVMGGRQFAAPDQLRHRRTGW